mgnify:CR=1 FL=1
MTIKTRNYLITLLLTSIIYEDYKFVSSNTFVFTLSRTIDHSRRNAHPIKEWRETCYSNWIRRWVASALKNRCHYLTVTYVPYIVSNLSYSMVLNRETLLIEDIRFQYILLSTGEYEVLCKERNDKKEIWDDFYCIVYRWLSSSVFCS